MNRTVSQHSKPNLWLWSGTVFFLLIGIIGQFYLSQSAVWVRFSVLVAAVGIALFFLLRTVEGKKGQEYWQGVVQEVKRVVWPTRREIIQTTGAVFLMTLVMGMVLWLVDSVLIRIVARLSGHIGS